MAHTTHHRHFGIGHGAATALSPPQPPLRRADAASSPHALRSAADRRERALIVGMVLCGIALVLVGFIGPALIGLPA